MFKKYFLQILVVSLLIIIAWVLLLIVDTKNNNKQPIQASIQQTQGDATPLKLPTTDNVDSVFFPIRNWAVPEPEILAKSAMVVNFKNNSWNNVLFQKSAEQILPIASLTKLMTAIIAIENYDLNEIIAIPKNNEELTIKDLLYIMLVESSNDAAQALAENSNKLGYVTFIDLMNKKAKEIGLNKTQFIEPMGLDSQNQSTVFEIAKITEYALKMPLLADILKTPAITIYSVDEKFIHNLVSTNKLFGKIPILIGGKTGYTDEAGGCMVTISNINNTRGELVESNYLITVILGSSQREEDTSKLIEWSQKAWIWQ